MNKEAIELPAGNFEAGKDIEPGRYQAKPISGSGNFIVKSGNRSVANTILGNHAFAQSEYVLELKDGDTIKQTLPVRYEAIE